MQTITVYISVKGYDENNEQKCVVNLNGIIIIIIILDNVEDKLYEEIRRDSFDKVTKHRESLFHIDFIFK